MDWGLKRKREKVRERERGGECAQSFSGECEYPRVKRAKRAAVVDVVVAVVEMLP